MSGTTWMYSDRTDSWNILFAQRLSMTYRKDHNYCDLTKKVTARFAQDTGAVCKTDTRFVRIRRDAFEEYSREQYRKELADGGEASLPGSDGLYPGAGGEEEEAGTGEEPVEDYRGL